MKRTVQELFSFASDMAGIARRTFSQLNPLAWPDMVREWFRPPHLFPHTFLEERPIAMAKFDKRKKKPFIPDKRNSTALSRNLIPGEAITVDGPSAIILKEIDGDEARLLIVSPRETISFHVHDASILLGKEGEPDEE